MKTYLYTYTEEGPIGAKFLFHNDLPPQMQRDIMSAFKQAGGIKIQTVVGGAPIAKIVFSIWKTPGGYRYWLDDPRTKAYLDHRTNHNAAQNIRSRVSGPVQHEFTGHMPVDAENQNVE